MHVLDKRLVRILSFDCFILVGNDTMALKFHLSKQLKTSVSVHNFVFYHSLCACFLDMQADIAGCFLSKNYSSLYIVKYKRNLVLSTSLLI